MQTQQVFEFNGQQVEFDLSSANIMVNATEMAKIYDKDLFQFMKSEHAKAFILECLKPANAGFLSIINESDLYVSKQRSGTWMHRVLAIKFAAWLDPAFELWVYCTIEKLMFGNVRTELKEKAAAERRRKQLHVKLLEENPDYAEMVELQWKANDMGKKINKHMKSQISIFSIEELN